MLAVVFFPKTNLDKVILIRERYDMNSKKIPPHITIVSPITGLFETQLIEEVEKVSVKVTPFSITLEGLTKTPDGCLFLMVKDGRSKVIDLHDKLYSGVLSPYLPKTYPFDPHITLGDLAESNDTLLNEAYSQAQNQNLNIVCKFDALTIIRGDGISPAQIVKVVNLKI
jgi:2'-5' RNA ligase